MQLKKVIIICVFLHLFTLLACESGKINSLNLKNDFKPGSVISSVACESDSLNKYALFLPPTFDPAKKWPLILCFDPHSEGLLPVNLFKDEAAKAGFIVAGSNVSKNGMSMDETTEICRKLIDDLKARFSVDEKSIYLSGFSGGSRVAGASAITLGTAAGVIGCGAGLPNLNKQPVSPFSYLAVGGTEDFNFNELKRLDSMLDEAGYTHHLLTFDGPHEWPPKELVPEIFTWMQFDRMRKGNLPADRSKINDFIDVNYKLSETQANLNNITGQLNRLVFMCHYLKGLTDIAPLESEIEQLEKSPQYISSQQQMQKILDMESSLQAEYGNAIREKAADWWKKESDNLKTKSSVTPLTEEGRMYKRVLGYLSLNAYMLSSSALKQDQLSEAESYIDIYRSVDPTNAEHRYMAAQLNMKKGKNTEAIAELKTAIDLGFKDFGRLRNDPVFNPLQQNPEMMKLLESNK